MKLQREMAKQQREVERKTARTEKTILKDLKITSKSTKALSSHDSFHSNYWLAMKLVVE